MTSSTSGEASTPPILQDTVASLELKLCPTPTNYLTVSLYHVETSSSSSSCHIHNELCHITTQLRENPNTNPSIPDPPPNFAIMDARRLISWNQLVIAANMAFVPRSSSKGRREQDIWSVVLNAAGSTHFGHVLRDYAFGEPQKEDQNSDNDNDTTTTKMIPIVAISIGTTMDQHTSTFTKVLSFSPNIQCTLQPLSALQNDDPKSPSSSAHFIKWYKLTPKEIEATSLEKAILTKIATKFYI